METLNKVAEIIALATGLEAEEITPSDRLADKAIDSLSLIDIVVRCEDAFGVRLEDVTVDTVADLVDLIDGKLLKKPE